MSVSVPSYQFDWSSGRVYGKDIINQVKIDEDGFIIEKYQMYEQAIAEKNQELVAELLQDDSVYAYVALKWGGKPIRMKYYQDAILTDDHRRIDVEAANQQGKSFSLCVKASVKFLRDHGKNTYIGLISKSMGQNSMNMRMVRKMLKSSDFKYTPGGNDNMTVMVHDFRDSSGRVMYSNTLVCSVASTSALGYPFDWELLDEFEFWENPEGLEYMYDQVLEPRTFQTRGQIIIYSNPNGKNFVSENLHKRKLGEQYQFHVYNIDFLDNPENSREEWNTKQEHVHPIIFASTMAALRTESEGAALNEKDIERCIDDQELTNQGIHALVDKPCHFFLDLGFVNDQSVLVGGWTEKQEDSDKLIYKFVYKVYPQAYEIPELWGTKQGSEMSVPDVIKKYGNSNSMFDLDITGKEGNEVLARNAGLAAKGTKMTGPWKATHYERFISLAKQGRIKVALKDNYIDSQNKNFVHQARTLRITTKMPDGRSRPYPLYHHTKETDHDDILDAIVGCLSMIDIDMNPHVGMFFVDNKTKDRVDMNNKEQEEEMENDTSIIGYDNPEKTMEEIRLSELIYGGEKLW